MKISKSKSTKNITQKILFFTEAQWKSDRYELESSTAGLFTAQKGETFVLVKDDTVNFLIGLGDQPSPADLQAIAAKFAFDFSKKIKETATFVNADDFENEEAESLLLGLQMGTYSYPFKKEHPFYGKNFDLQIILDDKLIKKISKKTEALCDGQFACMDWLNKPANFKKTTQVSAFLKEISKKYGFKYTAFDRKKAKELGLGAFLAVNQGSAQDCAFTILEYKTEQKNAKTVGLIGKCVLFDTGGISIKPSDNMHYMKSDMGGATAVIGTLIAAATLSLPVNIIAILPVTDNAVSGDAYLPSDVITAYNGKTIEVLNTDAEGRLTLADALSYLSKNYKTDVMIDLATLTGSSVRMFGNTCGALFSNNEILQKSLEKSGDKTNQRLWNMPLWDVWKDDFTSEVADFKNISLKPVGDCIVAAKFLEQFINEHPSWAHLDIAGVAFGNAIYSKEKAATGYGVQLLVDFLENL